MISLQQKLKRMDEIKLKGEMYSDVLSLFETIFIARDAMKKQLGASVNLPDAQEISLRLKEGFVALDKDRFSTDFMLLKKYFDQLAEIISARNSQAAGYINDVFLKQDMTFEQVLRAMISDNPEKCLHAFDRERSVFIFLVKECLKPALEVYCEQLREKIDPEQWAGGVCPVCGSFPFFAALRGEEGKRWLICPDCSMEWNFERLKCPFCSNDDHKKLSYFSPEHDPHYRVMLCKACKRYIKTADFRATVYEVIPEVEHLATLHLDIIAQKEGFKTEDVLMPLLF